MLQLLQKEINYTFKNIDLLKAAVVHKSYHEGDTQKEIDNERLELLGDAVIDLIISDYLYKRFQNMKEGDLSKIKAHLVSTTTLYKIAMGLNLGKFILLGKGEEKNKGRENTKIIASFFEALVGAIYLDQGFNKIYERVIGFYQDLLTDLLQEKIKINDYKSELQEFVQKKSNQLPMYSIIKEADKKPGLFFKATVYIDNKKSGQGQGKSKREAEQKAAFEALLKLGKKNKYKKLSEVFLLKND